MSTPQTVNPIPSDPSAVIPAIVYFKTVTDVAAEFDQYADRAHSPLRWTDIAPDHRKQVIAAYRSTMGRLLETLPDELELSWNESLALYPT